MNKALTFLALFALTLLISSTGFAESHENPPEIKTVSLGEFQIHLLSEGDRPGKVEVLLNPNPENLAKYLPDGKYTSSVNAFLIVTPDKKILVDTGLGKQLPNHLKKLAIAPEAIDIILLTHLHGDHIGGLVKDGQKSFPNAQIYLSQKEWDYWKDKNPAQVLAHYDGQITLYDPSHIDAELVPLLEGITGIATYGHTPGHTSFLIESQHEQLLIWGDLTHAMAIQMPVPDQAVTYDLDPAQAIASRKEILQFVTENNIPIAGAHIAYPGFGYTHTDDTTGGYHFSPIE